MSAEEFARVVSQTSMGSLGGSLENGGGESGDEKGASGGIENATFLSKVEQIAIFMNLAIPAIVPVPRAISQETTPRCAPRKCLLLLICVYVDKTVR